MLRDAPPEPWLSFLNALDAGIDEPVDLHCMGPSLTILDDPTREACVVRRQMSSTPLRALALLNDEIYLETSRKFAERMFREGGA